LLFVVQIAGDVVRVRPQGDDLVVLVVGDQTHVPKLRDAGLVAYDEDDQVVSLRSNADDIARYLDDEQQRFPWQYVYLGIALVGLLVVGLSAAAVPPFDAVSQTLVAFVLVVALLLTAVAHAAIWVSDSGNPFPDGPE
jgi:hypothetical protein